MAQMTVGAQTDPEPRSELAWFRHEAGRALWRPRSFARSLAREHYGIAGVLVALIAGSALSLSIDWLVLTSRGFDPLGFGATLVFDAIALALRLTITAALVAAITYAGLWVLARRRATVSLDQVFTAITFALVPLVLLPPLAFALGLAPETLVVIAPLAIALALRLAAGLVLNLRAILPGALAAVAVALVIVSGWAALQDQIARLRAVTYAYVPQLAPELPAGPAVGTRYDGDSWSLVLPPRWTNATRGVSGEAARFETDSDTLIVARVRGSALLTAEEFAARVAQVQRQGLEVVASERTVRRSGSLVIVDDRARGRYEGRALLLQQLTAVSGSQAMSLVFRFVEPVDEAALLAESASIAAGWRLNPER